MKQKDPRPVYLKNYEPPAFGVEQIDLRFELAEERTRVIAHTRFRRNRATESDGRIVLDGRGLEPGYLRLNGEDVPDDRIERTEERLIISGVPDSFELEVENFVFPGRNTSLEGLFKTGAHLCTQCEAEGFRKITYSLDRPDVMAPYSVTLIGDRERYPVLLSNGDRIGGGELADGRHWVRWKDPFRKPSYLFALVAGDLRCLEDKIVTMSGREVLLQIYVEEHNVHKCAHAMAALKQAMRWDEEKYGREYDLNTYMIVAADDFNMGAMENKGLNIFNSKFVLADPETATDRDYMDIETVIGHEYFHNWTGNRVTCRDWFQLTLKEGLTVFRDQEFSADMHSVALKRIDDVKIVRSRQFAEDIGPMAHPIQPHSYMEIQNFYTATVYVKGAEVIRMIKRLAGENGFRRGMDLYFATHDGEAVTTDDFLRAMEQGAGLDLKAFRRWFDQAGTPVLSISEEYDPETRCYALRGRQSCPPTPGQPDKKPFHIPIEVALLDGEGRELPLQLPDEDIGNQTRRLLELDEPERVFRFVHIDEKPVPSVLRGFTAPVKLDIERSEAELAFLMIYDTDPFSRWDAGQELALKILLRFVDTLKTNGKPELPADYVEAMRRMLTDAHNDPALASRTLLLPLEDYTADRMEVIDIESVCNAHRFVRSELASRLADDLRRVYNQHDSDRPYKFDAESCGRRALCNTCLSYLVQLKDEGPRIAFEQFQKSDNMTDQLGALQALNQVWCPERDEALQVFYERWKEDPLVTDKWLAIHATAPFHDTVDRVRSLTSHAAFDVRNPNRVRSLLGRFGEANPVGFHRADGEGYRFIADRVIELNSINPQIAARLVSPLTAFRRHEPRRGALMRSELERVRAQEPLAKNVFEVVTKALD